MQTRTLFEKCLGTFVIAAMESVEGSPYPLAKLDVGHVIGEEPWKHTIWWNRNIWSWKRPELTIRERVLSVMAGYNSFRGSVGEIGVNSQTMKHAITRTILVLALFVAARVRAKATTCVATKAFKVKEVCGKVANPINEPIARAEVDLLNLGSEVSGGVLTNDRGDFIMPNVPRGQYEIRVKSVGYITAAQQLIVTTNRRNTRCHHPVRVRLQPGSMGCSTVTK